MSRIGVVGTGHWGKNHLRNFDALGALAAFADVEVAAAERYADLYPHCEVYYTAEQLFEDRTIDGVVIATPADTHGSLTAAALAAGKHVLVEKPLCLDVTEAEELQCYANKNDLTLMVGHVLLYHPGFEALKALAESGELGDLRYIYSNRLSLGRIRNRENALWSFAPHDISMILALTNCPPDAVTARGANYILQGISDTTLSHLEFPNNIQAHIFVSWLHPYTDQRLIVIGSEAMVVFDDVLPSPNKVQLYRHSVALNQGVPTVTKAKSEPIQFEEGEPLRRECEAFLNSIKSGATPHSDSAEAVRVLKVLDACQRAIETGKRVIL